MALHVQIGAVMRNAQQADDSSTWYRMVAASLWQLDHDIDVLVDWLEASERGQWPARPQRVDD